MSSRSTALPVITLSHCLCQCRTYGLSPNNKPEGSTPTTTYNKVRFDTAGLNIIINDYTYATPDGATWAADKIYKYNNYSTAGDCRAELSSGGKANINLLGTNLSVETNQFSPQGYYPAGTAVFSAKNQVVDLTGGGYCGAEQPSNGSQFVQLLANCTAS